jgi:hypothetical protein
MEVLDASSKLKSVGDWDGLLIKITVEMRKDLLESWLLLLEVLDEAKVFVYCDKLVVIDHCALFETRLITEFLEVLLKSFVKNHIRGRSNLNCLNLWSGFQVLFIDVSLL